MNRLITFLILVLSVTTTVMAQYSLYDFAGSVTIKRGGKSLAVEKGMTLNATDMISIGDDSSIQILNTINSQVYKSTASGNFTTTRIMIDAEKQAGDRQAAIHDKIRFGKSSKSGDSRVYVEKGVVRRSMEIYDPEGENLQVDTEKLSANVVKALKNIEALSTTDFPTTLLHATVNGSGLKFMLENNLGFPVYFNVLRVMPGEGKVEISELGQPTGNYVVRSNQSIVRSQSSGLASGGKHILIMTHCYFDIDELIESVETMLRDGAEVASDDKLPVYMRLL